MDVFNPRVHVVCCTALGGGMWGGGGWAQRHKKYSLYVSSYYWAVGSLLSHLHNIHIL